jgi:predicted RNA-binding protein with TRAM domain
MKKIFKLIGIIALVAVIGFSFAACDDSDGDGVGGGGGGAATASVTGVTLNKNDISLSVWETATLTETVVPGNAKNKTVSWSTSDETKATVTDGVVTAIATGTAIITVTTEDGNFTDTCSVSVLPSIIPSGTTVTKLDENVWTDGDLPTSSDTQWFKYTATADMQYIHVSFGTLNNLYVQVYNSSGSTVGSGTNLSNSSSNKYISRSVTEGQVYYIKVSPYSSYSEGGTYQIGFTTSFLSPGTTTTPLYVNIWANGNIPTSSDVQWFKFTATASEQYIHVSLGTLTDLYVQVYASSGSTVGSETNLYSSSSNKYTSRTVTNGQEYYIRIRPYFSSGSGTYKIGFNTSTSSPVNFPPTGVTQLTLNTWADGNLPTSSDIQWFKFTATASEQYIHVSLGTLTNLYVQVYDSSGAAVGNGTYLSSSSSNKYISRTVTNGQEYYISIRPSSSGSGTYKIGFTTSIIPPDVTQLTLNTFADGNLQTSNDVQWFKFTATASTQYIHFSFGTLTNLYVQVYDASGAVFGREAKFPTTYNDKYASLTVTNGQEYYIRIRPPSSSDTGTYKIGFNTSILPITDVTQLTLNTWADGFLPTNSVQWFKFTATASTQYIHVVFNTLTSLYVQVYDSNVAVVGSETSLYKNSYYNDNKYISRTVTTGQEYYIKIRTSTLENGTYRIGFNTSDSVSPPGAITLPSDATQLTLRTWASGNLTTEDSVQWFKFTATASTQYIHVSLGMSTNLYVQVYDSNVAVVGSETRLDSSNDKYTFRTVTRGQEYYIKTRSPSSTNFAYRIGFTESTTPPN